MMQDQKALSALVHDLRWLLQDQEDGAGTDAQTALFVVDILVAHWTGEPERLSKHLTDYRRIARLYPLLRDWCGERLKACG